MGVSACVWAYWRQYLEVAEALREAKDDAAVHVVVITGAGDFFSAGADFTTADDTVLGGATANLNARHRPVGVFMLELMHFPKPVIAAVNGPAIGVGLTLLLHADVVYCTENTYFWTPFTRIAVRALMRTCRHTEKGQAQRESE
jgi:enoyl-CoA hydratase/carnithine racemase